MTLRGTQVGILGTVFLVLLMSAAPALARTVAQGQNQGMAEDPVNLGDLWEGVGTGLGALLPSDILPPDSGTVKKPTRSTEASAAAPEKEKKPSEPAPAVATPSAPQPSAPYRVYAAPVLVDEDQTKPDATPVVTHLTSEKTQVPQKPKQLESLPPTSALATTTMIPLLPWDAPPMANPQFLPVASNHDLPGDHSAITRAIIFIHDISRDASEGLSALTLLAGADEHATLILAPQFLLEIDVARFAKYLPEGGRNVARWPYATAPGWPIGGDSVTTVSQRGISSFTALDILLLYLADTKTFPHLRDIVVAGHGVGADFTQRYAAVGRAPDLLAGQGILVRFLVANASSYLYFTPSRPVATGETFSVADPSACESVDLYPYGLGQLVPYARTRGGNAIRQHYPERKVTILVGDKTGADPFPDVNCAAVAQGKNRLTRARYYERHIRTSFGDTTQTTQNIIVVPNAAYDLFGMFGSYCGLAVLFGNGVCGTTK